MVLAVFCDFVVVRLDVVLVLSLLVLIPVLILVLIPVLIVVLSCVLPSTMAICSLFLAMAEAPPKYSKKCNKIANFQ